MWVNFMGFQVIHINSSHEAYGPPLLFVWWCFSSQRFTWLIALHVLGPHKMPPQIPHSPLVGLNSSGFCFLFLSTCHFVNSVFPASAVESPFFSSFPPLSLCPGRDWLAVYGNSSSWAPDWISGHISPPSLQLGDTMWLWGQWTQTTSCMQHCLLLHLAFPPPVAWCT